MISRIRDNRRKQHGAIMVELAIVLPVLMILVFSIIQMGVALNRVQAFHAAAREGARVGSLENSTAGQVETAALNALQGINGAAPTVDTGVSCFGRPGGQRTVLVSGPHLIQIPFLPDRTINLTGDGVFRCEG